MPGLDGTGPLGKGARTGRGRGKCVGTDNFVRGQGLGLGLGSRRRLGNANVNSSDELTLLKEQAKVLQEGLDNVNQRISELGQ